MTDAAPTPADAAASKADERRAIGVACGAHALHDGYTDLIYVMLPIWQAEFGLGYAALGLLRGLLSGTMAGFQIPSGAAVASGSACRWCWRSAPRCRASAICSPAPASASGRWCAALLIGGLGASTQHPLASALVARAFAGPRSLKALGTYNFAGDIGKMSVPAAASLLLVLLPWRPALAHPRRCSASSSAVAIFWLTPRCRPKPRSDSEATARPRRAAAAARFGFPVLLVDRHDRQRDAHGLPDLPAVRADREGREPADRRPRADAGVRRRRRRQARLRLHRRAHRRGRDRVADRRAHRRSASSRCCRCRSKPRWCCCRSIGVALNGTSSVLYGSVPELVAPEKRTRAFGIFYTGTIGSGAVAPALYGLVGDALGVPTALMVVAGVCLLTLPLALVLIRRQVAAEV